MLLQGVFSVMLNGCLIYRCFTPQAQNSLVLNSLQKNRIIFQKNCASLFDEWQMCLQLPTVDVPQLSHLPSLCCVVDVFDERGDRTRLIVTALVETSAFAAFKSVNAVVGLYNDLPHAHLMTERGNFFLRDENRILVIAACFPVFIN